MNNATKIMGTRPPLVYLLMLRDYNGLTLTPIITYVTEKRRARYPFFFHVFIFYHAGWEVIPRIELGVSIAAWLYISKCGGS